MASVEYWDGWAPFGTSPTSTTTPTWGADTTTTSSSDIWFYTNYSIPRARKILVSSPEHWEPADNDSFVQLVNIETQTGWIVEMVIDGNILITDPDIELRSMKDFVPLLKSRASAADVERINAFFKAHTFN